MALKPTKDFFYIIAIAALLALCGQLYFSYQYLPTRPQAHVYYNKNIRANQQIINTVREADEYVYFAVYTFTRNDIADALIAAKERGLEVKGVMDRKQNSELDPQKDIYQRLIAANIPIVEQDHSAIMHMKVVVTDQAYVSGSYNWTAAATTSNDEVIEVGYDEQVRKQYEKVVNEVYKKYSIQ